MPRRSLEEQKQRFVLLVIIAVEIALIAWVLSAHFNHNNNIGEEATTPLQPQQQQQPTKPVHLVSLATALERLSTRVASSPQLLSQVNSTLTDDGGDVMRLMSRAFLLPNLPPASFWVIFRALSTLAGNESHASNVTPHQTSVTSSALAVAVEKLLELASHPHPNEEEEETLKQQQHHDDSKKTKKGNSGAQSPPPPLPPSKALVAASPFSHSNMTAMATAMLSRASHSEEGRTNLASTATSQKSVNAIRQLLKIANRLPHDSSTDSATRALFQLSLSEATMGHLAAMGAVATMTAVLNSTRTNTQDASVWCLVQLTRNEWKQAQEVVFERKAVPAIIRLLSHASHIVATGAAALINNLSIGSETRSRVIVQERALMPLLRMVDVNDVAAQHRPLDARKYATMALTALTAYSLARTTLLTMNVVPTVVNAINHIANPSPQATEVHMLLIQVLSNLAIENADIVAAAGGLSSMIAALNRTSEEPMAAACVWGVHNVVLGDTKRIAIAVSLGVLPPTFKWLNEIPCGAITPAISLLRGVVALPAYRSHFTKDRLAVIDATAGRCMGEDWVNIALEIMKIMGELNPHHTGAKKSETQVEAKKTSEAIAEETEAVATEPTVAIAETIATTEGEVTADTQTHPTQ